ncbi:DUF4145 domain-containing protein [Leptospira fainei]|uniref:DUF4145 domain-containing protein n=1 Tax=Leptospira fainei TaxID=48782 RepID=UPI00030B1749|nr:DUF4145 domain-containing protein [Leptospira fainei]
MVKKKAKQEKDSLIDVAKEAVKCCTKAKRAGKSLTGRNFYAEKFNLLKAKAHHHLEIFNKSDQFKTIKKESLQKIVNAIELIFDLETNSKDRNRSVNELDFIYKSEISKLLLANSDAKKTEFTLSDSFIPSELFNNTRSYIERVAKQACGSYEVGFYDASAVMFRRLLETLIIECFEKYSIGNKIKNGNGDYFYLKDLISAFLSENSWSVSRNSKTALPKLKEIGDLSAHSRRYNATLPDLNNIRSDLRVVIEELLHVSGLKD